MVLQGVDHFKDIRYTDRVSYGELFLQNEYEMSVYNMDEADVGNVKARFDSYETAAKDLLAKRLPVPAYDNVLKTSHAFNVLDARGAVGVTERARYFGRVYVTPVSQHAVFDATLHQSSRNLLRHAHVW